MAVAGQDGPKEQAKGRSQRKIKKEKGPVCTIGIALIAKCTSPSNNASGSA